MSDNDKPNTPPAESADTDMAEAWASLVSTQPQDIEDDSAIDRAAYLILAELAVMNGSRRLQPAAQKRPRQAAAAAAG